MSPPQPQPPHRLTQTPRDQSRPAHAPGNPSRCDHISQSVLTTTSHTTTGCGTTGGNHPTVQTTRPMSPPQPQPPHDPYPPPLRRFLTTISHAPGNPSWCDHISQSVLTTTSHTTTGCGTTGRNHPTVQPTRPMSPPKPQPPHRPTQTPPETRADQNRRVIFLALSLTTGFLPRNPNVGVITPRPTLSPHHNLKMLAWVGGRKCDSLTRR